MNIESISVCPACRHYHQAESVASIFVCPTCDCRLTFLRDLLPIELYKKAQDEGKTKILVGGVWYIETKPICRTGEISK
jgi:hypothetical protein